jgi:hypothetical protein
MSTSPAATAAAGAGSAAAAGASAPSPRYASSSLSRSAAVAGFFFSRFGAFSRLGAVAFVFVRMGPGPPDCGAFCFGAFLARASVLREGGGGGGVLGRAAEALGERLLLDPRDERAGRARDAARRRARVVLDRHRLACRARQHVHACRGEWQVRTLGEDAGELGLGAGGLGGRLERDERGAGRAPALVVLRRVGGARAGRREGANLDHGVAHERADLAEHRLRRRCQRWVAERVGGGARRGPGK